VVGRDYPEHLTELELALTTELRMGYLYGLTWEMVDWSRRMLNIPTSKNGEAIHIPLNNAAMADLKSALPDKDEQKSGRIFRSKKTGEPLENWRHRFGKELRVRGSSIFAGTTCAIRCQSASDEGREAGGYCGIARAQEFGDDEKGTGTGDRINCTTSPHCWIRIAPQ
jgi:hypothetical protein